MTVALLRRAWVGVAASELVGTLILFGGLGEVPTSPATKTACTDCDARHARLTETNAALAGVTE